MISKSDVELVIGIGGAGKRVLEQMGFSDKHLRVLIDSDASCLESATVEYKFLVDKPNLLRRPEQLPSELMDFVGTRCERRSSVKIICGPRSKTTAQILVNLRRFVEEFKCSVFTILFRPFNLESRVYFDAAESALEDHRYFLNTHVIDLEQCLQLAAGESSLADVLIQANRYAIDVVTSNDPHNTDGSGLALRMPDARAAIKDYFPVRLVCRVVDVEMTTEHGSAGDGVVFSITRSIRIGGTMECNACFGVSDFDEAPVKFNLWTRIPETPEERKQVMADCEETLEKLQRLAELREAVLVSVKIMSVVDGHIDIYDPVIEPTGIPFAQVDYLA